MDVLPRHLNYKNELNHLIWNPVAISFHTCITLSSLATVWLYTHDRYFWSMCIVCMRESGGGGENIVLFRFHYFHKCRVSLYFAMLLGWKKDKVQVLPHKENVIHYQFQNSWKERYKPFKAVSASQSSKTAEWLTVQHGSKAEPKWNDSWFWRCGQSRTIRMSTCSPT